VFTLKLKKFLKNFFMSVPHQGLSEARWGWKVFYNFPSLKATSQAFLGAAAFIAIKKR
jgi:hypothetical protein